MKSIVSLRGVIHQILNKDLYGTSWENERLDRANETGLKYDSDLFK